MTKERIRFLPNLQEKALRVKKGEVKKHRAAEDLGRESIPQILASVENTKLFFAQIGEVGDQETAIAILEKMCGAQVVRRNLTQPPGVEVLNFLSKQLIDDDTSKERVAANFLEGIFLYPSRLYKEIPRDKPSEQTQRSFEEAIRVSTEILYSFAWTLILSDHATQEKALGLFQEKILNLQAMTLFDLASRPYSLSTNDWKQHLSRGTAAMVILRLLSVRVFGEERRRRNFRQLNEHDQEVEKRLERFPPDPQRKKEALKLTSAMQKKIKGVEREIKLLLSEAVDVRIYYSPTDKDQEPLLSEAMRLQIEMVGESLLRNRGMDFVILDFPEGSKMLIFHGTLPDDSSKETKAGIIRQGTLIPLSQKPYYQERLNVRELKTIIKYLAPDYLPELLLASRQEFYERVQTSILALPGAGQRVRLRLPEEEMFRQMGLTSLFFKPYGEGGILVKLEFGKYSFSFALDRDFSPLERKEALFWEKFGHLDEEKKLFLLNLTYVYLDSLLHPERKGEEILGVRKRKKKEENEFMSPRETKEYLGARIYLRVLPLGHRSHKIDDEEANKRIRERFGFTFGEIWQTLLSAEEDLNTLDRIEGTPRLRGIVKGLIDERIRLRPEGVRWVEVDGKMVMKVERPWEALGGREPKLEAEADNLLGITSTTKPEEIKQYGLFSQKRGGRKRIRYEVTPVLVWESPHPKEVVCPGAAKRIALLAK